MNGSVVRTASGAARPWRMRQWPCDPTVANLIFVDHQAVPTADSIQAAVDYARQKGARAIRTSALFPRAAAVVFAAGFEPLDTLALLRIGLEDRVVEALPGPVHRISNLQPWMHRRAATVDRDAFGVMWGNDAASLRDIGRATPHHHARMVGRRRSLAGFALSGAAADNGYLQRVAVATDQRRSGIARDLVVDALTWMHARGHRHALVNTGVGNEPGLALYAGLGFERLDAVLTIAERRL